MSAEVARFMQEGRFDRARDALQRMLRSDPQNPHVLDALAVVHAYLGEFARSLYFSQAALNLLPGSGPLRVTYANTLMHSGALDQARQEYEKACAAPDAPASAWSGLSALHWKRGDLEAAERVAREGLSRHGPTGPLLTAYFSALTHSGQAHETVRHALALLPQAPASQALQLAAVAGNYCQVADMETVQEWHKRMGAALARDFPLRSTPWAMSREKERVLRIGIVSSDLREHPVAAFIAALVHGHDRLRVLLHVFSTVARHDEVTAQFKAGCASWVECAAMTEEQIREAILSRQVDILIDLHGLTNGHRLGVFAMRAAPVQMTYCGYPNTTGLATMDCRLVDAHTDPEGDAIWHSEELVRMPGCFLCFTPRTEKGTGRVCGPDESSPGREGIVFGSFNALAKLSDETLDLWSRVLQRVEGSRLIVKTLGFADDAARKRLASRAEKAGIAPERITLLGPTPDAEGHLRGYQQIDIALDATPYNGTTTTCEALQMGVPVVVLKGNTHAARVGVSLLHAAGFPQWIGQNEDDYVRIAAELARSVDVRSGRSQRARQMLASPLCDAADWNRRFEHALRRVWHRWCERA
jgi:predicted O-linked N-acetylglucosamine transferase (SPINDLY family)